MFKRIPGFSKYVINKAGIGKRIEDNEPIKWHMSNGYVFTVLVNDIGKRINVGQHRALALTYLPMPVTDEKLDVNHINGIKNDNRLENLEWATRGENLLHAFRTGLANSYQVILTNLNTGEKLSLYSVAAVTKFLKVHSTYFHESHSFGKTSLMVKGYNVLIQRRPPKCEYPRGVCAKNMFTGEVIITKTIGQLGKIIGVEAKVIKRIFKNIRFDYPVNGWDIRVVENHIEWPVYTSDERKAFEGVYFIHQPVWVKAKDGTEKLFGSTLLAAEYTGTNERTIRSLLGSGDICARKYWYRKHIRKVLFNA